MATNTLQKVGVVCDFVPWLEASNLDHRLVYHPAEAGGTKRPKSPRFALSTLWRHLRQVKRRFAFTLQRKLQMERPIRRSCPTRVDLGAAKLRHCEFPACLHFVMQHESFQPHPSSVSPVAIGAEAKVAHS